MKKIKYQIIFEGEMLIGSERSMEEVADEICSDFYEKDCGPKDAAYIRWEEVNENGSEEL